MKNTITIKELKDLKDKKEHYLLIDVRSSSEYRSKHIKDSHNIPLDEISKVLKNFREIKGKVVFLCRTGIRSSKACTSVISLNTLEKNKFFSLEGGVEDLEKEGFEIITGRNTWDLERQVRFLAGILVLLGVIFGFMFNKWGFILSGFIGGGLVFASITNTCLMGMILMKLPYNKGSKNIHVKATIQDIISKK